jgi:DNA polymerase I-like protein with 3'-5' exonuclease and polymerase domains
MRILTLDIEHSFGPLRPHVSGFYMSCVGTIDAEGKHRVWWFDHVENEVETRRTFRENLKNIQKQIDEHDIIVVHNLKHDMSILRAYGISFEDVDVYCTMVAEFITNGQDKLISYNLNETAQRHGLSPKLDKVKTGYWDKGIDTYDVPAFLLEEYVIDDCRLALEIYKSQQPIILEQDQKRLIDLHMEFTRSLSDMEINGLLFDTKRAKEIVAEYSEIANGYAKEFKELCGEEHLNMNSNQQLHAVVYGGTLVTTHLEWVIREYKTKPYSDYGEKKIRIEKEIDGFGFKPKLPSWAMKNKAKWKVDEPSVQNLPCSNALQRKAKKILLAYRKAQKVVETLLGAKKSTGLLNKIATDGKVHTELNQCIAGTGRLTSSNPNGQNLPRGATSPVKECIIAGLDFIMQYDLSQIEWRGAAFMSQDQVMMDEINSGIDQHSAACVNLMEMELNKNNRFYAKIFNFRMIYDGTFFGFWRDSKMPNFSKTKWKEIIIRFWDKYFGLRNHIDKNVDTVYRTKKLKIFTGRFFKFNKNKKGEYNTSQIANYPVQGLAGGDILPLLTVIIRRGMRKLNLKSKMILTVHDSIVFDVAADEVDQLADLCLKVGKLLPKYIENYFGMPWNVNLDGEVEVGKTYGSIEKYKSG